MAETVSLELLLIRINEVFVIQERMTERLGEIETRLSRIEANLIGIDTDLRALARVMLRLGSRVYALEEARAGP